jgi:hypothetical protein
MRLILGDPGNLINGGFNMGLCRELVDQADE